MKLHINHTQSHHKDEINTEICKIFKTLPAVLHYSCIVCFRFERTYNSTSFPLFDQQLILSTILLRFVFLLFSWSRSCFLSCFLGQDRIFYLFYLNLLFSFVESVFSYFRACITLNKPTGYDSQGPLATRKVAKGPKQGLQRVPKSLQDFFKMRNFSTRAIRAYVTSN